MTKGTRRSDMRRIRQQRKKPKPLWMQYGVKFGLIACVGGLLVGLPYWAFSSGWVSQKIDATHQAWLDHTATSGLAINDVFVNGRSETPSSDVLMALRAEKGQPMLAFDLTSAKEQLETLPWIKMARVERRFPNTVLVSLVEREPVGILQREGVQSLVDENGIVLASGNLGRWAGLPVLVGEGSPKAAPTLLWALANQPDLYRRVKALTYVNQRRWDVLLDNMVTIHLPEDGLETALTRLNTAQKESHLLDKAIKSIDLRQTDRITVEPTDEAAARMRAPSEGL